MENLRFGVQFGERTPSASADAPISAPDLAVVTAARYWCIEGLRQKGGEVDVMYSVTFEYRGRLPDLDAFHVTVRVSRDGEDLGLFRTSVSGPQVGSRREITGPQYWWLVAEQLAVEIERLARDGRIRDEWAESVVDVPINLVEVNAAANSGRVVPDLVDDAMIATFAT